MRKTLIAAIIVALVLLAAAIGVIVYMEKVPSEPGKETTAPATSATETTEMPAESTVETTEETVALSLPTENPEEVTPEVTFGEEEDIPSFPVETGTGETEDPDANLTPEDEF